jgi:hypothetical protein
MGFKKVAHKIAEVRMSKPKGRIVPGESRR